MPTLATILALVAIVLLIGSGAWMALWGSVTVTTAGMVDGDDDRAGMIRVGIAILLAGMILFVAGANAAARMLG